MAQKSCIYSYCDFLNNNIVQNHLQSMLNSPLSHAAFTEMQSWLPGLSGQQISKTPALLCFPTSSNVVKLLTAPTQVMPERSDNSAQTKGAEEFFPGHSDVRTAEVVTEFTKNSTRQQTGSQNELNEIRNNSWLWLPSNFQAGGPQ